MCGIRENYYFRINLLINNGTGMCKFNWMHRSNFPEKRHESVGVANASVHVYDCISCTSKIKD